MSFSAFQQKLSGRVPTNLNKDLYPVGSVWKYVTLSNTYVLTVTEVVCKDLLVATFKNTVFNYVYTNVKVSQDSFKYIKERIS